MSDLARRLTNIKAQLRRQLTTLKLADPNFEKLKAVMHDVEELLETVNNVNATHTDANLDAVTLLTESRESIIGLLEMPMPHSVKKFRDSGFGQNLIPTLEKLNTVQVLLERSKIPTTVNVFALNQTEFNTAILNMKSFLVAFERVWASGSGVGPAITNVQLTSFIRALDQIINGWLNQPKKPAADYPTDWAGQDEMQRSVLALKAFVSEWNLKQQKNKDGSAPYLSPTQLSQFEHTLDQVIDGWEPGPSEVDQTMAIVDDEQLRGEIQHYKRYFEGWETTPNDSFPHPPVPFTKTMRTRLVQIFDEVLNGKLRMRAATQEQTEPTLVLHEMEIWQVQQDPKLGTVLVQDDFKRAGVDLETDTFPLTLDAISYSRLFEEHLASFQTTNHQCMLANRDRIRQESLKRWHRCLTALSTLHGLTNADEIYRDWLKFLEEVKQASGRMQEILVQDIPVFKPA